MTDDYKTNQSLKDQSIEDIREFLKENKASKDLMVALDFLEEYILSLECNIELNVNLAEEERKTIKEITHYEQ